MNSYSSNCEISYSLESSCQGGPHRTVGKGRRQYEDVREIVARLVLQLPRSPLARALHG